MKEKERLMANDQSQQPQVAMPLPKGKKNAVQVGCICMMLSVAMYGLVFATLTSNILEPLGASDYVSLFTLMGSLGVTIMTPIGGKLGDIVGRRNIVVIPGLICAIAGIAFAFTESLWPLMILRLVISLAQGAFTAAPYTIVSLINERKDVPKAMGELAAAISLGGFGGSIIAGILTDAGLLWAAILLPAIPLLLGVALIGFNLPNQKREGKVSIDWTGIVVLVIALCGILLPLNFGSSLGWTDWRIIIGFVIGIVAIVVLVKVEQGASDPLIPLKLFKNKQYTAILIVCAICYFYQTAMNTYASIGVQQVMGGSATIAGSLQMPRTIITMILPTFVGVWVGKSSRNSWKAMLISTICVIIPMAAMGFTTPTYPVAIYFVALAITGISESFRSTSMLPSAQATLAPADIGIGTSLVNFANSLATSVSAAVLGAVYNAFTVADATNATYIQNGVNAVFWTSAIITVVGFFIVLFVIRPQMEKTYKEEQAAEAAK